mmetsp:Transcript_20071/g.46766  ORF Transcript_20071/g.46766 Transcript_20071/m.46766 type:complete len:208 (+) Transcript_20071:82-705(+)
MAQRCRSQQLPVGCILVLCMAAWITAGSFQGFVHTLAPRNITRRDATSKVQSALVVRRYVEPDAAQQLVELSELSPLRKEDIALNTVVFVGMCIPFVWAAFEFWGRIAFGQSFGTGSERVVFPKSLEAQPSTESTETSSNSSEKRPRPIGKEGKVTIGMDADTNRGRVELGTDALVFAYILMFLAGGVVAISLVGLVPIITGQVAVQ